MANELETVRSKLLANKALWPVIAEDTEISTKTLQRMAAGEKDAWYSNVAKVLGWFKGRRHKKSV